jgi:hypothetical protein
MNYSLEDLNDALLTIEQVVADSTFNLSMKKSFGFSRDEFIIKCKFQNTDCDRDMLVWEYYSIYGNCFKFNSGYDSNNQEVPIIKSTSSGNLNGFVVELFTGLTPQEPSRLLFTDQISSGAAIFINNQSYLPTLTESLTFKPGVCINIGLEKSFTSNLESPYSDCIKSETSASLAVKQFREMKYIYRKRNCRALKTSKILL